MTGRRRLVLSGGVGLGALLLLWRVARPYDSTGPCEVVTGPVQVAELPEASGLAVSRRNPGLIWSHNDSGNESVLFAIDGAGVVRASVRVSVATYDWEDVSTGPCLEGTCLYIADIGDNGQSRERILIFRVPEPAPGDVETGRARFFGGSYSDGPHNAEAMFVVGSELYVVTRDRVGGVYRSNLEADLGLDFKFERLGQLDLEAVTDAETSPDGAFVIVRTQHEVVLYRTADVTQGHFVPFLRFSIDRLKEPQGEGVALDGDMVYLASEGRPWNRAGRFVALRCNLSPSPDGGSAGAT